MTRLIHNRVFIESTTLTLLSFVVLVIAFSGSLFLYEKYWEIYISSSPSITKPDEVDETVKKILKELSIKAEKPKPRQPRRFYYQIELASGRIIDVEQAAREADLFIIKDRQGLILTVKQKQIIRVTKVKISAPLHDAPPAS